MNIETILVLFGEIEGVQGRQMLDLNGEAREARRTEEKTMKSNLNSMEEHLSQVSLVCANRAHLIWGRLGVRLPCDSLSLGAQF
jgi:hypothetical protein